MHSVVPFCFMSPHRGRHFVQLVRQTRIPDPLRLWREGWLVEHFLCSTFFFRLFLLRIHTFCGFSFVLRHIPPLFRVLSIGTLTHHQITIGISIELGLCPCSHILFVFHFLYASCVGRSGHRCCCSVLDESRRI